MKEILLEILNKIDELSRSVETGDIDLSYFREELVELSMKIKGDLIK